MFAEGNGPVFVTCLQAYGVNKSKSDILNISGYVQSNITGRQLPLTMEGMRPEESNGIPANCRFFVQALFRDPMSPREGIVEERFLQEWRDFSFFFTADGKLQQYRFSPREIASRINEFSRPLKKPPAPTITKRVNP
jgi:hypothetical protein